MKLSKEIKELIEKEYDEFKDYMYDGKTKEERDELAQFFTPPKVSIKLIEELSDLDGDFLDPASGSGNLLVAALIAGVSSDRVFGNDYDPRMVKLCRERLNKVCDMLGQPHIQDWQVHRGDALDLFCITEFSPDYKKRLEQHYIDTNRNGAIDVFAGIFGPDLTPEQIEFLKEVD